jgi:hypothetical protein
MLKMEAERFSLTLVDFHWTSWFYIPENSTLLVTTVRTSNPTFLINCIRIDGTSALFFFLLSHVIILQEVVLYALHTLIFCNGFVIV